ncbi:dTDP-4-dehydrorhamnose 3,5-epimerase family protein [Escherichia coli]|uniref:dTDP-4-dehydrorhamnose 3,5-epimerase family protein n=1 Tax=Escherichia coli TaxID=562 RepID=UPI000E0F59A4|nr:dTDP-4-dehydrorhamnose 3,5-epimerase [Escherichia coli]
MGEISVKTGNNARNGGKNSLNRLIRCVCGKKIGPDPRNFNQRVSLGRNDLLIRTFPNSETFGSWVGVTLSSENKRQLWIPEGFAHGFLTLSEIAEFVYKTNNYYSSNHERGVIWNDEEINIAWPSQSEKILSQKDINLPSFRFVQMFSK